MISVGLCCCLKDILFEEKDQGKALRFSVGCQIPVQRQRPKLPPEAPADRHGYLDLPIQSTVLHCLGLRQNKPRPNRKAIFLSFNVNMNRVGFRKSPAEHSNESPVCWFHSSYKAQRTVLSITTPFQENSPLWMHDRDIFAKDARYVRDILDTESSRLLAERLASFFAVFALISGSAPCCKRYSKTCSTKLPYACFACIWMLTCPGRWQKPVWISKRSRGLTETASNTRINKQATWCCFTQQLG